MGSFRVKRRLTDLNPFQRLAAIVCRRAPEWRPTKLVIDPKAFRVNGKA